MKDFLEMLITPLMLHPETLEIQETHDDLGILFSIKVSLEDIPSIIGKDGATAKSIRQIMRLYGARHKARVSVRFLEPLGSSKPQREPALTTKT